MTTPAAPATPAADPQQQPPPPGQQQPPPGQQQPNGQQGSAPPNGSAPPASDLDAARASLAAERAERRDLEKRLAALQQAHMSDEDKRLAQARAEGKAEAEEVAARKLAASELRHALTGRVPDPDKALEYVDLSKLIKDGEPNRRAIAALADHLAPAQQPPPPGRVPAGAREPAPEQDWLGSVLRR